MVQNLRKIIVTLFFVCLAVQCGKSFAMKSRGSKYDSLEKLLFKACEKGRLQEVKGYVIDCADINYKGGYYKRTSLMIACDRRNLKLVEYLLLKDADVTLKDNEGKTALMYACDSYQAKLDIVKKLVVADADVNEENKEGKTPLMYAVSHSGNKEVIKHLIKEGADIYAQGGYYSKTVLMIACDNGYVDFVEDLLAKKVDVKIKDNEGKTALMHACDNYQVKLDIVKKLVVAGADVNEENKEGKTPLMYAVSHSGNKEVIKHLIEEGADIYAQGGYYNKTVLMIASDNGYGDFVDEYLVSKDFSATGKDEEGKTALMHACDNYQAKLDIVKKLVKAGAKVNEEDKEGKTPLMYAVSHSGNKEVIKHLIEEGADIYAQGGYYNKTVLMIACDNGYVDFVEDLLAKKVDVKIKDNEGKTALMHACDNYQAKLDIVKMLVEAGACVIQKDDEGKIALKYAKSHGENKEVVVYLKRMKGEQELLKKRETAILAIKEPRDVKKNSKKLIRFVCEEKKLLDAKQIVFMRLLKVYKRRLSRSLCKHIVFNQKFFKDKKAVGLACKCKLKDRDNRDIIEALIVCYSKFRKGKRPNIEHLLLTRLRLAKTSNDVAQLFRQYIRLANKIKNKELLCLLKKVLGIYKTLACPGGYFFNKLGIVKEKEQMVKNKMSRDMREIQRRVTREKKRLETAKEEEIKNIKQKKKQDLKNAGLLNIVQKIEIYKKKKKGKKEATQEFQKKVKNLEKRKKLQIKNAEKRAKKRMEEVRARYIAHIPHKALVKIFAYSGLHTLGESMRDKNMTKIVI